MENRDHAVRGTVLQAELRSPRFAARIEGDVSARAGVVLIHPRLQYIHRVLLHCLRPPFSQPPPRTQPGPWPPRYQTGVAARGPAHHRDRLLLLYGQEAMLDND